MDIKENVQALLSELESGVSAVFTSGRYDAYLKTLSRFHDYSFRNCMLIYMQCPDASRVAGFQTWKKDFHRYVVKGAKAIKILAPVIGKIRMIDTDGNPVTDEDGNEQFLMKPVNYRVVNVFDISQTSGEPLPSIAEDLSGDMEGFENLKQKVAALSPVPVEFQSLKPGLYGYYSISEKKVVIDDKQSQKDALSTMIHEIAHALLHDKDTGTEKEADSRTREVQAESIAFVVANYLGLDTSKYSFGYVASWSSGKDTKELAASLETIGKTAGAMIEKLAA